MQSDLSMRLISTLILLFFLFSSGSAQDVELNTQSEVNAFNPATTTILGDLVINSGLDDPINDISPLSGIITINGDFVLDSMAAFTALDMPMLSTIGGSFIIQNDNAIVQGQLSNLDSIGGNLVISNQGNLPNYLFSSVISIGGSLEISNSVWSYIDGFSSLNSIGESLIIMGMDNLTNIMANAFPNLTTIPENLIIGDIINPGGTPVAEPNLMLFDISGFQNITEIQGSISIRFNDSLSTLYGLHQLQSIGDEISIAANPELSSLDAFQLLTVIPGNLRILNSGNLTDISSLSGLVSIGNNLEFSSMGITDLDVFSNLTSIYGSLSLISIGSLTDVSGLSQLDTIGNEFGIYDLGVSSLDMLDGIEYIPGNVFFRFCDNMLHLDDFEHILSIGGNLYLDNNPNLVDCCGIQHLLSDPNGLLGTPFINFNANECSSEAIIEAFCSQDSKTVRGQVYFDYDSDCQLDGQSLPVAAQTLVEFISSENIYSVITDASGAYEIFVDTGLYQINVYPESFYAETCGSIDIDLTAIGNADIIEDIILDVNTLCPQLEVDVATWALRECVSNDYYIEYCNQGTIEANDAYIELTLDADLFIENSEVPFSGPDTNHVYTFYLGTVPVGDCGDFKVDIQLPCDGFAGEYYGRTYCVDAHIYPDDFCGTPDPNWDGSSTLVSSECVGDSIRFRIQNVGVGNMLNPRTYYVIEDQVIFLQDDYQLPSGGEFNFAIEATGNLYRLEAAQAIGHPGGSSPSTTVEACGPSDAFSLGLYNQFGQDDNDGFVSIECREVTGSYDPNDKQAFPTGYGPEHYIERGQDIEYLIRFQNTGTDTAFKVVIKDVIQADLDLLSINPGVSSHPYVFEVENDTVAFIFNDIYLVDSTTNEPASHGFVKFKISQQPDLPLGTVIENTAGIYFDFNPPIFTNTTFHTIGEKFVEVNLIDDIAEQYQIQSVRAFPNPFSESIHFELKGLNQTVELRVFDLLGHELSKQYFHSSTFSFHRGNLNEGMYIYEISIEGKPLAIGKMMIR